jgi:hypothetical protein
MKKEINEKTFELNITNELLNLSKSFVWYMEKSPILNFFSFEDWKIFLGNSTVFAEGLTQEEESNPKTGGYDVSINYSTQNGEEGRLLFLQYKAGIHVSYSILSGSQFERKKSPNTDHVCFTFNDAANGTQHSTLRNLAKSLGRTSDSVLYVFPRITKKKEFHLKVGQLIHHSSFVPILEIDKQGSKQKPKIEIKDHVKHKFRTSYDGKINEVNLLLLLLELDQTLLPDLISELICIQIERLLKYYKMQNRSDLVILLDEINVSILGFMNEKIHYSIPLNVQDYINDIRIKLLEDSIIPPAPTRFTTIIPKEGLKLNLEEKLNLSNVNYQIF